MTVEWLDRYHLIASSNTEEGLLSFWRSPGKSDASWDDFLMKTPLGQFQQSSMWAQVKETEGWDCLRAVATIEDRIIGGFQILWRKTRLGHIGYVSKGPVAVPESPDMVERLVVLMRDQALNQRIRALIVQPPDECRITNDILDRHHFIESNPMDVIETTLLVDVSKGRDALEKRMNKDTRRRVRLAQKSGIVIREGNEKDASLFFTLMNTTCKRRGVKPNPAREETLHRLWSTFFERNCIRVTFAEYDHEAIAGIMSIPFGEKVNVWKKGWNGTHHDRYPNDLLYYDTLHWACANKFNHCDYAGFDRNIACSLMKGQPLSESQKRSRDIFNLRFGGVPKFLPPARIWFTNPIFPPFYKHIVARIGLLPFLQRALH